jgi:uncharacterized protein with PIN domain
MKFAVDIMLGRLAKWLRILGFDTFYSNKATYSDILKVVLSEGRILLTRNSRISDRQGIKVLIIKSENFIEQLQEVIKKFELRTDKLLTRCPVCNTIINIVQKEIAQGKVPPFIYLKYDEFAKCNNCDKYFWKGTHLSDMIEKIKNIEIRIQGFK